MMRIVRRLDDYKFDIRILVLALKCPGVLGAVRLMRRECPWGEAPTGQHQRLSLKRG